MWYVRKSFYWMLWVGLCVAAYVGRTDEVDESLDSPGAFWDGLLSPLAGIILAVLLRFGTSLAGLALAYPLARAYEARLPPRTSVTRPLGLRLDRLNIMRAFRALRWTHDVRQAAIRRLGTTGERLSRLDPILDVANVSLFFVLLAVVVLAG